MTGWLGGFLVSTTICWPLFVAGLALMSWAREMAHAEPHGVAAPYESMLPLRGRWLCYLGAALSGAVGLACLVLWLYVFLVMMGLLPPANR